MDRVILRLGLAVGRDESRPYMSVDQFSLKFTVTVRYTRTARLFSVAGV